MGEAAATFLVVVDETPECARALRYAALRARRTGGKVMIVHVLPPVQFLEWRGAQEEIEAEEERNGLALLDIRAKEAEALSGARPETRLLRGIPRQAIMETIAADRSIRALVLGAAAKGRPGPLVDFFAGQQAGKLSCIVILVPGGIADDELDRLT